MNIRLTLALAILLLFGSAAKTPLDAREQTIETLSEELSLLQNSLADAGVNQQMVITGGSVRTILDHVYHDKPLVFRDFDLVIILNSQVDRETILSIAHSLEANGTGTFLTKTFSSRPRSPKKYPGPAAHNAGYGFYLETPQETIFDLSFFFAREDLLLNGFMNIDELYLPLPSDSSLAAVASQLKNHSYDELLARGILIDPNGAYKSAQQGPLQIRVERALHTDPHSYTIRALRTFYKMGYSELPNSHYKAFHNLLTSAKAPRPDQYASELWKVFGDAKAAQELFELNRLDHFRNWAPELEQVLDRRTLDELSSLLERESDPQSRFLALSRSADRKESTSLLLQFLHDRNPEAAQKEIFFRLIGDSPYARADKSHLSSLLEQANLQKSDLQRALKGSALNRTNQLVLFLRLLQKQGASDLRLEKLFPRASSAEIASIKGQIHKKRIGLFTGALDPFLLKHQTLITTAMEECGLDEVYVAPVYFSEEERGQFGYSSWDDRCHLISLATQENPNIRLVPKKYHAAVKQGLGFFFEQILEEQSDDHLVHIMGSDAFTRYHRYYVEGRVPERNYQIAVALRRNASPFPVADGLADKVGFFHPRFDPTTDVSSAHVRTLASARGEINPFVEREVEATIFERELYAFKGALGFPIHLGFASEFTTGQVKQQFGNVIPVKERPAYLSHDTPLARAEEKVRRCCALYPYPVQMLVVDQVLCIRNWGNLPGVQTEEWTRKMSPLETLRMIEKQNSAKVQCSVIAAFSGFYNDVRLFETSREIDLSTLELDENTTWDEIFTPSLIRTTLEKLERHLFAFQYGPNEHNTAL